MPGIARHTPLLTGSSAVRLIVADTALLLHIGELLGQLIRDDEWYEDESSVADVVAASWALLDSWYSGNMIGQVAYFVSSAPSGWLELDGSAYAQVDYPELFAKLPAGWISGSNFTLPDVQDMFLPGAGSAGTVGAVGGANSYALTVSQLPPHTHTYTMPVSAPDTIGAGAPVPSVSTVVPLTATGSSGSGASVDNRPEFLTLIVAVYAGRE